MHPIREKCKRDLIQRTWAMHELVPWAWSYLGDKYGRNIKDPEGWAAVARLYFIPELTVLITNEFNVGSADSARDTFYQLKMYEYGPHRIVECLQAVAKTMKQPRNYIPCSIEFNGKVYSVLGD